ncbi:MAG TPA: VOC family protein [Gammaproteobacteria bacterium]|nr:VOC family protein [Gammaproteobacteria bacterium]
MGAHLRIARPVTDLERSAEMYRRGLRFELLGRFADHDGFDGVMLGRPNAEYHFELTFCRDHPVHPRPTGEDLLVLYIPDEHEWLAACADMEAAGFRRAVSFNPYWEARGRTYEDPDGYRIVIERAEWSPG